MANLIVRLLRIASFVLCLIVIASFAIFAVGQTKTASAEQQEIVNTSGGGSKAPEKAKKPESSLHKAIDEASEQVTSPFSGIVSKSSGEWAVRGVNLLLALIVYGFGLGFLARVLRVRV
jgi:hypothetical protein